MRMELNYYYHWPYSYYLLFARRVANALLYSYCRQYTHICAVWSPLIVHIRFKRLNIRHVKRHCMLWFFLIHMKLYTTYFLCQYNYIVSIGMDTRKFTLKKMRHRLPTRCIRLVYIIGRKNCDLLYLYNI